MTDLYESCCQNYGCRIAGPSFRSKIGNALARIADFTGSFFAFHCSERKNRTIRMTVLFSHPGFGLNGT